MSSLKETLERASKGLKKRSDVVSSAKIAEMISKVFTTRNLLHFAHWSTNSFAAHMALGDLYDEIVNQVDEIVECYQGKNGLLKGLYAQRASIPGDICEHVKSEAEWIAQNKEEIAGGTDSIMNLLDELDAAYLKAIYKLENLR